MRTAAIVLAGGRGTRLGAGTPKANVRIGEETLLERALAVATGAGAGLLLVVAPASLALDAFPGAERVADLDEDGGPLAGLVPALARADEAGAAEAWCLAVDLAWLRPADLVVLARALGARPDRTAVVPAGPRGLEPQAAAVRPALAAPAFRAAYAAGERALHRAYEGLGAGLVRLPVDDPDAWPGGPAVLAGVNLPADLERARTGP
jgi:molybdopterin-guanine dinucleotide biosynthesis protein A